MNDKSSDAHKSFKSVAPFIDLGLRFAIAIILGVGGGYWLDSKFHTTPLLLILGLFLGATAGFLTVYRAVYPRDSTKSGKDE
ncbi:MAG: AtpZ/AtpI family protein [bacterium]